MSFEDDEFDFEAGGALRMEDVLSPGFKVRFSGFLADVAAVAGEAAATSLADHCGGVGKVFFPPAKVLDEKQDHWLIKIVGKEAALKIANMFAIGENVGVPRLHTSERVKCWLEIKERLLAGQNRTQIARIVRVDVRTVQRVSTCMVKLGFQRPRREVGRGLREKILQLRALPPAEIIKQTGASRGTVNSVLSEERKRAVDEWRHLPIPEIAQKTGIAESTINKMLKVRPRIISLHKLPIAEIVKKTGASEEYVRKVLVSSGLRRKPMINGVPAGRPGAATKARPK